MKQFRLGLDVLGNVISNVATPTNPSDAANKAYVDSLGGNEVSIQNDQPVDNSEIWIDWDDPTAVPNDHGVLSGLTDDDHPQYLNATRGHAKADDLGWVTPTLLNGWVNYGGGYVPMRYCRKAGVVYVQGMIKNGTAQTPVINLIAGCRPAHRLINVGMAVDIICRIDVTAAGDVIVQAYGPGASNAYVSIMLSFPADQ